MKVAVVGVGGSGSAAVRHLAQAGHTVVGFEQFELGHTRGSSHGESRILRYTYPDPLKTSMVRESLRLWLELQEQAGEELFVRTGSVFLGSDSDQDVLATERAMEQSGLPYERLTADTIQERFPALRLQRNEVGLFQPESGMLRAGACVLANARVARDAGAAIHEHTAVVDILARGGEVIIRTDTGLEQVFDSVIVTAGAWSGKLFARLNIPFTPTLQQVVYLNIARNAEWFEAARFPVWVDNTLNYYGFPSDGRIEGIKFASHEHGERIDPDGARDGVDDAYIQRAVKYAAIRMPDLGPELSYAHTCVYTNTPDDEFVFDQVPDAPNVWLVSGCSGHGFKFTVLLGKMAADLATGRSPSHDISRLSMRRFW
jgi:monomeric sarcosine oxidase